MYSTRHKGPRGLGANLNFILQVKKPRPMLQVELCLAPDKYDEVLIPLGWGHKGPLCTREPGMLSTKGLSSKEEACFLPRGFVVYIVNNLVVLLLSVGADFTLMPQSVCLRHFPPETVIFSSQ